MLLIWLYRNIIVCVVYMVVFYLYNRIKGIKPTKKEYINHIIFSFLFLSEVIKFFAALIDTLQFFVKKELI